MSKCTATFFDTPKEQSIIKKLIVTKYFPAWVNVIKSALDKNRNNVNKNLAYFDLFSGPGIYCDGTTSTPIEIMQRILQDSFLVEHCLTFFNDKNESFISELENNISKLEGYDGLKHKPNFSNQGVSIDIFKEIINNNIIPTLSFIDPFGYEGVSTDLLDFLIRSFGCDIILFFNYNDINRAISNTKVEKHMNALFTKDKHEELKMILEDISNPHKRERIILSKFSEAVNECYKKNKSDCEKIYVFPFRFQFEDKNRTSHYVIFLTKHKLGLKIMKDIMWGLDNNKNNQIASYEYIPNNDQMKIVNMFETDYTDLKNDIINYLSDKKNITVKEIIDYYAETIYIGKNIKRALIELENEIKISVPPHRKDTMGDKNIINII